MLKIWFLKNVTLLTYGRLMQRDAAMCIHYCLVHLHLDPSLNCNKTFKISHPIVFIDEITVITQMSFEWNREQIIDLGLVRLPHTRTTNNPEIS